jgi:hypothetical protein
VAALNHVTAPAVQRRVDQDVGACRHQQIGASGESILINQIALQMKNRALLESGAHLVHADHTQVGVGVHRPGR